MAGREHKHDSAVTQVPSDRPYPAQLRGCRFVEEDEPRSETAHRVQERIVRRDDADIGTIKRRDETDRVGQSGMIRDEEDRTASRNPIEPTRSRARVA